MAKSILSPNFLAAAFATAAFGAGEGASADRPQGGRLLSFAYRGRELLGNGGCGYVQLASEIKKKGSVSLATRLARQTPDMAEAVVTSTDPGFPFDLESHYILRADEPGFHNYSAVSHDPVKHPGVQSLGQFNFTLRADPAIFGWAAVDDERIDPLSHPGNARKRRARDGRDVSAAGRLAFDEGAPAKGARVILADGIACDWT